MHVWDIASGKEVRQVAASEFAFGAGAEMTELKPNRHFLKASGDTLEITELPPHGGVQGYLAHKKRPPPRALP